MEKWKAKNASHFPTPPTTATGHIYYLPRYTNNLLVQKIGQTTSAVYTINLPVPSFAVSGANVTINPGATTGNTSTGLLVLAVLPLLGGLLVFVGGHESKAEFADERAT